MVILICGASGSGKSEIAEERLAGFEGGKKFYVATAKIFDSEMLERVKKHKAMRAGKNFITIEREKNLGELDFPGGSSVLIESLTTWLANEIFDSNDFSRAYERIMNDILALMAKCENVIIVSDNIFSDGMIYDEATEFYRKTLATLMIEIASETHNKIEVIECVAGLAMKIK